MKKYIAISVLAISAGVSGFLTSCEDALDADKYFDDRRTIESVFTNVEQTNGWLSQAFNYLTDDCADVITKEENAIGLTNFSDDMYYGDRDIVYDNKWGSALPSYNTFKQGDYPETYGEQFWQNCYRGIRQASIFIQNVWMCDALSEEDRADLRGQARFVRAYFYFMLLRKYGPVPLIPNEGADYTKDYADLSYPRNSYEEVAQYIGEEMVLACKELKDWSRFVGNSSMENIIRPTRGAALAVRAYAYIFAASPLANGQLSNGSHPAGISDAFARNLVNRDGKQLLGLTYDESKWARAAAACRDVMLCPAQYELYHSPARTSGTAASGYPATLKPFEDGDFSTKNWPEGYADIDPYLSYRDFFTGAVALDNSEIIFSRGYNTSRFNRHRSMDGLVAHQMPNTLFGFNCHGMTQKMVDAYYMKDGSDCPGKDSEYGEGDGSARLTGFTGGPRSEYPSTNYPPLDQNVSMQYANREPRFYASVGYNGARWWHPAPSVAQNYPQIFYYRGTTASESETANNGYTNSAYYLRTGIGIKKYVNPEDYRTIRDGSDYSHIVQKWEPAIRYADILLLYAEALNELTGTYSIANWDGSDTYSISRTTDELKKGIRPVRCRAGVPDLDYAHPGIYGDRDELRKAIKRERMIELFAENKRYYDLRRWMDAAIEEAKPVYGCNVLMTQSQREEFHQVVPIYNLPTIFNDKMYFWPISTNELKRNKNLVQNPGWQYYD